MTLPGRFGTVRVGNHPHPPLPGGILMRFTPVLALGIVLALPLAAQAPSDADGRPFLLRKAEPPAVALQAYREKPYLPIRASEVRSAGFLTEDQMLSFGESLGSHRPGGHRTPGSPAVVAVESEFEVNAPEGDSYQRGDTLIVAIASAGPKGWGQRVIPTGMVEVLESHGRHAITRVLSIYGPLRGGQVVFRAAPIDNPGEVKPVPAEGPVGAVISLREVRELLMPSGHLFSDLGQRDGIKLGDFVEVRSDAANADATPMATGQVVHVNPNSSTIKLMNVTHPAIEPGTAVVRVATLP